MPGLVDVEARERLAGLEAESRGLAKNCDEIWRAIDALRAIVQSNAVQERDLFAKVDRVVDAVEGAVAKAAGAIAAVEGVSQRVKQIEDARIAEIAAEGAERRVLFGIVAAIGGVVGAVAIWLLKTALVWLFPALGATGRGG